MATTVPDTTVARWIGTALARDAGVRTCFGVAGRGNLHLVSALTGHGARLVAAGHEGGAAAMADGYARVSGATGVLTVAHGPGLTNALTGLAEAARCRTPLLVLAADAPSADNGGGVDQAALAAAAGLIPDRVTAASTVRNDLRRAYRTALVERRTVLLSLPPDVQAAPVADSPLPGISGGPRLWPGPAAVAALADALAVARRPVFLAGRAARGAKEELTRLSERVGALLATSMAARGLFRGEEFSLDVSGPFATPVAAELIAGADLVVAWGCPLSALAARDGTLVSDDATVVQVDSSPAALGGRQPAGLAVTSDAGTAARAVSAELDRRGQRAAGYRTAEVARRLAAGRRWRDVPFQPDHEDGRIDPRTLTVALDDLLPAERTVAADAGGLTGYPAVFLDVPDEHGLVVSQAFQAAGLGLATALGAALARPDRLTVAAVGAGGALSGAAELDTAVRLGLGNLLAVVYDDEANGAAVPRLGPPGHPAGNARRGPADLARIAAGYGWAAVTVRRPADLAPVGRWLGGDRSPPLLVHAKVSQGAAAWWLADAVRAGNPGPPPFTAAQRS